MVLDICSFTYANSSTQEQSEKLPRLDNVEVAAELEENPPNTSSTANESSLAVNHTEKAENQGADHAEPVLVPYHAGIHFSPRIC